MNLFGLAIMLYLELGTISGGVQQYTPVSEILALTPVPPLFGHKSGKWSRTHWIVFYKGDGTYKP